MDRIPETDKSETTVDAPATSLKTNYLNSPEYRVAKTSLEFLTPEERTSRDSTEKYKKDKSYIASQICNDTLTKLETIKAAPDIKKHKAFLEDAAAEISTVSEWAANNKIEGKIFEESMDLEDRDKLEEVRKRAKDIMISGIPYDKDEYVKLYLEVIDIDFKYYPRRYGYFLGEKKGIVQNPMVVDMFIRLGRPELAEIYLQRSVIEAKNRRLLKYGNRRDKSNTGS
jgi:hypothetical protein